MELNQRVFSILRNHLLSLDLDKTHERTTEGLLVSPLTF